MKTLSVLSLSTLLLCSCAGLDAKLGSPVTQADVKWACMGLRGSMAIYAAATHTNSTLYAKSSNAISTTCAAAAAGNLTNTQQAFDLVMSLTGELSQ